MKKSGHRPKKPCSCMSYRMCRAGTSVKFSHLRKDGTSPVIPPRYRQSTPDRTISPGFPSTSAVTHHESHVTVSRVCSDSAVFTCNHQPKQRSLPLHRHARTHCLRRRSGQTQLQRLRASCSSAERLCASPALSARRCNVVAQHSLFSGADLWQTSLVTFIRRLC